jgi:hypothetical protein
VWARLKKSQTTPATWAFFSKPNKSKPNKPKPKKTARASFLFFFSLY